MPSYTKSYEKAVEEKTPAIVDGVEEHAAFANCCGKSGDKFFLREAKTELPHCTADGLGQAMGTATQTNQPGATETTSACQAQVEDWLEWAKHTETRPTNGTHDAHTWSPEAVAGADGKTPLWIPSKNKRCDFLRKVLHNPTFRAHFISVFLEENIDFQAPGGEIPVFWQGVMAATENTPLGGIGGTYKAVR